MAKQEIDWSGLEDFRATLPTFSKDLDFKGEHFRYVAWVWDIVKARYILSRYPHEMVNLNVADTMDAMDLPKEPLGPGRVSMMYIDEKHVADVDLEQPLILGRVVVSGKTHLIIMDGLHRIVKAYRTGVASLSAQILTVEEAAACRVR